MYIECQNCGAYQHDSAPTQCQLCGYDPALDHELVELDKAIVLHKNTKGAAKDPELRQAQLARIARRSALHRQGYGTDYVVAT